MSTLTITRGAPGSGKDTWAADVQAERPGEVVVVNRDATRKRLFGSDGPEFYNVDKDNLYRKEKLVTQACHTEITEALKAGFDVICSDTNLPVRRCRELRALAKRAGADFEVNDSFASVPLEVCLERNAARERSVPDEVIRSMYDRFIKGGLKPLPAEEPEPTRFKPYSYDPAQGKPKAIIVDTDGTVANHKPHRSPYDTSKYAEDTVITNVVELLDMIREAGWTRIIGLSGRSEDFRDVTLKWWGDNVGIVPDEFYMRKSGDTRKDTIIKDELFEEYIAGRYNVIGVIDDRPSVNRMWRAKGLTTFQVGDPDEEF